MSYHSDIAFTPAPGSVLLVDESDEWIYSGPSAFLKFIKKHPTICLTATCSEDSTLGIER